MRNVVAVSRARESNNGHSIISSAGRRLTGVHLAVSEPKGCDTAAHDNAPERIHYRRVINLRARTIHLATGAAPVSSTLFESLRPSSTLRLLDSPYVAFLPARDR